CIGALKRDEVEELRIWTLEIAMNKFEVCYVVSMPVSTGGDLTTEKSQKNAAASAQCSIYGELDIK
ncbi:hypothetical protein CU097_004478, partial [Rhizopus azygosporus]